MEQILTKRAVLDHCKTDGCKAFKYGSMEFRQGGILIPIRNWAVKRERHVDVLQRSSPIGLCFFELRSKVGEVERVKFYAMF